jgi:hypothetical protein
MSPNRLRESRTVHASVATENLFWGVISLTLQIWYLLKIGLYDVTDAHILNSVER